MFKKRKIVLFSLLALISLAIILNIVYRNKVNDYALVEDAKSGKVLGDAQYVNGDEDNPAPISVSSDYFSQAKVLKSRPGTSRSS